MELITSTMRVMTWNIWWRFGPWEQRQPAIVETLRQVDADVVALQEVWDDNGDNQADALAAELGMHAAYDGRMRIDGVGFGNAILSRWPIESTETLAYVTDAKTQEDRVALRARIDGPKGRFAVFSTHLNWRPGHSAARQSQVEQLCEFVDRSDHNAYPVIVCGDFNADPTSDEIRMMTGRAPVPVEDVVFIDAWEAGGDSRLGATWSTTNMFTTPGFEPDRRIDYIFTGWAGENGAGHVTKCQVAANQPIDGTWPSDHFAVVADLRY